MTNPVVIIKPMYGYKVTYSARVLHNTKFHHNVFRKIMVHAYTNKGAKAEAKAYRKKTKEVKVNDELCISVEMEYVYSIQKVGKVIYKAKVGYEDL